MQVIHQMIAQMIPAKTIGKGVTFHPPQAHRIAHGVLKIAQRLLELFKDSAGRADSLGRIVVVDQIRQLALTAQRWSGIRMTIAYSPS